MIQIGWCTKLPIRKSLLLLAAIITRYFPSTKCHLAHHDDESELSHTLDEALGHREDFACSQLEMTATAVQKDAAVSKQKSAQTREPETYAPLEIADYLDSDETIIGYLSALLDEGDPRAFAAGLGDVARARGMSQIARDAGLSHESLYKALSRRAQSGTGHGDGRDAGAGIKAGARWIAFRFNNRFQRRARLNQQTHANLQTARTNTAPCSPSPPSRI
jgi:probable addiction module antidote protein